MTITGGIVLYAVIWFLVFLIVLPLRLQTQGDVGEIVPGTPPGAPAGFVVARKARIATVVAVLVWLAAAAVIVSGVVTVRDLDVFGRMGPPPAG